MIDAEWTAVHALSGTNPGLEIGVPRRFSSSTCRRRGRSGKGATAMLLLILVAVIIAGLVLLLRKPGPPVAGPEPEGAGVEQVIRVEALAGSSISSQSIRATVVQNIAPLCAIEGGADLVAAGRFEPSREIPGEGVRITWPLSRPLSPGQTLWVIWLDESRKLWLGTGDTATVAETGRAATATVHHFSTLGLSQTSLPQNRTQADEKENRTRYTYVNVVRLGRKQADIVDQAKMEAAKKIYEAWVARAGAEAPMPRSVMKEIYQAGDFKTIKTLIENDTIKSKPRNHSLDMADHRVAMILETLTQICKDNGWKIYRSDSGNQTSGMKSDVDQTVYVYKKNAEGKWVRSEVDDAKLVDEFNKRFRPDSGLSIESLDIATIAGKDKFPDPRRTKVQLDADGLRAIRQHAVETMESLRKTPGAYTFCGAVVQQMQLRALDAIERQLLADPTRPGGQAGAREMHPDLKPMLGVNGLNNLVCMEIGPGDENGEVKPREISRERAIEVLFDSLPPELRKGHAYDAAVANYLEFMHHLKDPAPAVKYHLRALDDGVQTVRQLDDKTGRIEYENIQDESTKKAHLATLLGQDLVNSPIMDRWKIAFDISVSLRKAHKNGALSQEAISKAFEPLAKELAGQNGDWKKCIDQARKEYDKRCQEFMLHSIVATSTQRVLEWTTYDADDPPKRPDMAETADELALRRSLNLAGNENDAKWQKIRQEIFQNHADIARLQLLYSFREMRPDVVKEIVALAQRRGVRGEELVRLNNLVAESKDLFFGLKRYWEFKPLYHAYFRAYAANKLAEFRKSVKEHILIQAGYIDTDAGRKVTRLFQTGGFAEYETRINDFFIKNKAGGITSRYIRNTVFDFGNVDGVIQVVRAFSESGGDPNVTWNAMVQESISALPIVGQVYGIARAPTAADAAYSGAIMTVCMLVPQAGIAAMALSLTESGYALYESEISQPLNDTVADAIYRGYVGPSLYSFEKEPPRFEPADAETLAKAAEEAERLKAAGVPNDPSQLARLLVQIKELRTRRINWEASEAEKRKRQTYEGSAVLGTGAQWRQRRLTVPTLYDSIEPMILYCQSTEGPVDFTTSSLTEDQKSRLAEIERTVTRDANGVSEETCFEYEKLMTQSRQHERAQRYLERAKTSLELMHQIRRDSLWPWVAFRAGSREMVDARAYAVKWCKEHNQSIINELKLFSVPVGDEIPDAAAEELGMRLLDDLTRSRQLWQWREYLRQEQEKQQKDRFERRQGALAGEALAEAAVRPPNNLSSDAQSALKEAGTDLDWALSLGPLADAVLERHMPLSPPEVEVDVRKVPINDGAYEFRPDIQVTADPTVYQPPYRAKMFQLDPTAAREAADAGKFKGLPLSSECVRNIREHLDKIGPTKPDDTHLTPWVLVFVFCDGCEIPQRIVPETVANLPVLEKVEVPDEKIQAHLFGSAAVVPEPEKLPAGPLEIRTIRMKKSQWNGIEVTSQAMAQLDPAKPETGLKFVVYRSQGADEPLKIFNKLFVHYVFPDMPIWQPAAEGDEPRESSRLGTDRFLIADHISVSYDSDKLPHKPYFYQVGQIPVVRVDDDLREKGREIRSNVLAPTTEAEIRILTTKNPDGTYTVATDMFEWPGVNVALGLTNQQFDAWDAHFTATVGGWTSHCFSGCKEGEERYSAAWAYAAPVHIRIPPTCREVTVSISAQGDGMSASTSVTIASNPTQIQQAAQQVRWSTAELEKCARERDKDVNDAQARVKAIEQVKDRKPQNMSEYGDVLSWVRDMRDYTGRYATLRERKDYIYLNRENTAKSGIAQANEDWRAEYQCAAKDLELGRIRYEIEVERIAALESLNNTLAACSNIPDDGKKNIENTKKELELFRQSAEQGRRGGRLSAHERMARAALYAGDIGQYEQAQNERINLLSRPEDKRDLAGVYRAMANDLVVLTGDRGRGAELLARALQTDIEGRPEQAQSLQQWYKDRAVWWPKARR